MRLLNRILPEAPVEERYTLTDYISWINDFYHSPAAFQQTYVPGTTRETMAVGFEGYTRAGFKGNGPVFALMAFRMALFSQVRWTYQQLRNGRPGDLFSLPILDILNRDPYLNVHMIQDVDLSGNFYGRIVDREIKRLRPDWVQVVANGPLEDYDSRVVGYAYYPGGPGATPNPNDAELIPANEVIHWYPIPDPEARWRGMSWLTPVVREIQGDDATVDYKKKFFENGATPNLIIKYDPSTSFENFQKAKEFFDLEYSGPMNAGKTLHLGGGADATVVGKDLKELEYSVTQGKGESRLAAAARVPAVLVGFSEGLQAATYSNFSQARRAAADSLLHPLWVSAAGALGERFLSVPGARLWYDARDIPFMREDALEAANVKAQDAQTIRTLVDAGFTPDSIKAAMTSGDWTLLVHTGLFSVQLQEPGAQNVDPAEPPARSLRIIRDEHGFVTGADL